MATPDLRLRAVPFSEIRDEVSAHAAALPAPFDDFFESHILKGTAYRISVDGTDAGFACVHNNANLTQFHLRAGFRKHGRDAFAQARLLRSVTHALVPASDAFFVGHALEVARSVEMQAYLFARDDQAPPPRPLPVDLRFTPATADDEAAIRALCGDFLGDETSAYARNGNLTLVHRGDALIGIGVHAIHVLTPKRVSIGMYVAESERGAGIGTAIIRRQMNWAADNGLEPTAGCWYYNHASRRTLQAAGMAAVNRWIKIAL
jgi:RimJ/RimL family protein N-acetyltransferase